MGNIIYIFKRLKDMNYKAMFDKIDEVHKKTGMSKIAIFNDMRRCATLYGAGYVDYDLFEMYNLTPAQRDTYLTRGRNNELVRKYCDKAYLPYFMDKSKFNKRFNKYLKRDWLYLKEASKEDVFKFFDKHDIFMAKPVGGGCGKGIEKINVKDYKDYDELYNYLTKEGNDFEIEELIIQHPEVSKVYPCAINTLRVVTIVSTKDGKSILTVPKEERKNVELVPHIIATYFRIGNGGKYVDNFNSEGMCAPVDDKTGIVKEVALDKKKNVYAVHPMTGTPIKGFKLPYFEEALEMCKEACKEIPEMGYVGWDVGFTPNGPLFLEGNEFPGHDIYQLPLQTPDKIGMMPKFEGIK